MLRGAQADLEVEDQVEQELSQLVVQASWETMEALEATVLELGVLRPSRRHSVDEIDVTLGRLHHAGEVCLPRPWCTGTNAPWWPGQQPLPLWTRPGVVTWMPSPHALWWWPLWRMSPPGTARCGRPATSLRKTIGCHRVVMWQWTPFERHRP